MDFIDRGLLSSFFNAGGYVLDFTNSTFDTFTSVMKRPLSSKI